MNKIESHKILLHHNVNKRNTFVLYLQDTEIVSKRFEQLILRLFPVVLLGSSRK